CGDVDSIDLRISQQRRVPLIGAHLVPGPAGVLGGELLGPLLATRGHRPQLPVRHLAEVGCDPLGDPPRADQTPPHCHVHRPSHAWTEEPVSHCCPQPGDATTTRIGTPPGIAYHWRPRSATIVR